MDSARWEQVQALFLEASALAEPERSGFLQKSCGSDAELLAEVRAMVEADSQATSILDRGLPHIADRVIGPARSAIRVEEVGAYRLIRFIGEGGMGVVYLAERKDAGNQVAIKFLLHAGLSPARRERFAREIKLLGKLKHPAIARLYDAGTLDDGTPWFVMEYVEGKRLVEYCQEATRTGDELIRLFCRVCEAVQYAHGQEIIHRDLKPSNIMVDEQGTPRLLDFGIAKELHSLEEEAEHTRSGLRLMTPEYAAPEWAHEGIVGPYTDVYSLGIILYQMLAGKLPLKSSDEEARKPSSSETRVSGLSKSDWRDLDRLCLTAMQKEASARYQSVEALLRDIDHYLKQEPLEAQPESLRYRLSKFVVRNRRAVLAALLALAVFAGMVILFTVRLAKARNEAEHESDIARTMNRFLSDDLLGRSDPFRSGSSGELFVDAVNRASPAIDVQFSNEPLLAARLHQTLARAFDNRSDWPQARREYDRALDLFLKAEGSSSEDAMVVRLQRAALEARSYQRGSLALAKLLLNDVERSMSHIAKPREELPIRILWTRGIIEMRENNGKAASADFSLALRRAQATPSVDEGTRTYLKQLLGTSYIHLSDGPNAERLFREIIEALAKSAGPDSPETLRSRIYLSQALMIQGKYAEALKQTNAIYPSLVRTLGEDHERTLAVLGTRAVCEGSLAMYDQAIRDDLKVYELAVRKLGPVSFFSIGMLSDAAQSQCKAGRYATGESNARRAFEEAKRAFGIHAGMTGGCSYSLATCLIAMNRLDEASDLLDSIDVNAATQASGDATAGASIALAKGEIALRRNDYGLAEHYARVAATAFDRPEAAMPDRQELAALIRGIEAHEHASK